MRLLQLLLEKIVRLHGIPDNIVSDRGFQFPSSRGLCVKHYTLNFVNHLLTTKQKGRPRGQIKLSNNTCDAFHLSHKMTGCPSFHWRNLHTTILSTLPLNSSPSMQIMDIILSS